MIRLPCRIIINGEHYEALHEDIRTAEEKIRMVLDGIEVTLSVQVKETEESVALHLLPGAISSYAVYDAR